MAGTPRKPRPAGPRGKIRVAGSSPSVPKVTPDSAPAAPVTPEETVPADAVTSEAVTGDTSTEETVSLTKPSPEPKKKIRGTSLQKPAAAQPAGPRQPPAPKKFLTWSKVAIVAAVALVIAVIAIVAAFKPGTSEESNVAFIDSSATSELKAQAGDRICAVLSIDPTKFDDWANKAKTGLTGEALKEFNDYQSSSKDLAAQSGQGAECKVDLVAVSNMDSENATVIATLVISTTQQGVAVLSGPGQARTELGLQKVDGQWLISRISDF